MPSDLRLDHPHENWLTVEGHILRVTTADIMLDHQPRRSADSGHRRALVHDFKDGLTINFARDYPGGVTINGRIRVTLNEKDIDAFRVTPGEPGVLRIPPIEEVVELGEELRSIRARLSALEAKVRVK